MVVPVSEPLSCRRCHTNHVVAIWAVKLACLSHRKRIIGHPHKEQYRSVKLVDVTTPLYELRFASVLARALPDIVLTR